MASSKGKVKWITTSSINYTDVQGQHTTQSAFPSKQTSIVTMAGNKGKVCLA
jgi:hypothetical protein